MITYEYAYGYAQGYRIQNPNLNLTVNGYSELERGMLDGADRAAYERRLDRVRRIEGSVRQYVNYIGWLRDEFLKIQSQMDRVEQWVHDAVREHNPGYERALQDERRALTHVAAVVVQEMDRVKGKAL